MKLVRFALALAILAAPIVALAADPTPPMDVIKTYTEKVRAVVLQSKTDQEMRDRIKGMMDEFVWFEEFGRNCLADHWAELKADQQSLYLKEFRSLLERTYLRRFKAGREFTVVYNGEVEYNDARDRAIIKTTITSDDVTSDVDYRLHLVNGMWKIYDIYVDDVSMMRNYRKSFLKVYESDGFDALVAKMQKKTSDKEDE